MNSFIVNVEAVAWRSGKILMIERGAEESYGAGWLSFPGGKADWNGPEPNLLELTASREILEEVGLTIEGPWHYIESKSFGVDANPVLDIVLFARSDSGDPFINSPGEVANVAWMTSQEIRDDTRTQQWTRDTLDRLEAVIADLGW